MSAQAIALCCTAVALVFLVLGWVLGHKRGHALGHELGHCLGRNVGYYEGWQDRDRLGKKGIHGPGGKFVEIQPAQRNEKRPAAV